MQYLFASLSAVRCCYTPKMYTSAMPQRLWFASLHHGLPHWLSKFCTHILLACIVGMETSSFKVRCCTLSKASVVQVMQDHREWRLVLISTALELTKDQRSCSSLVSELCRLCLMVQDTSKAVRALQKEREQVRLYNQKSGRFDPLITTNVSTERVLQAMDQQALTVQTVDSTLP